MMIDDITLQHLIERLIAEDDFATAITLRLASAGARRGEILQKITADIVQSSSAVMRLTSNPVAGVRLSNRRDVVWFSGGEARWITARARVLGGPHALFEPSMFRQAERNLMKATSWRALRHQAASELLRRVGL